MTHEFAEKWLRIGMIAMSVAAALLLTSSIVYYVVVAA